MKIPLPKVSILDKVVPIAYQVTLVVFLAVIAGASLGVVAVMETRSDKPDIQYVWDERTDLCFAMPRGVSRLTLVPCTPEVLKAVEYRPRGRDS